MDKCVAIRVVSLLSLTIAGGSILFAVDDLFLAGLIAREQLIEKSGCMATLFLGWVDEEHFRMQRLLNLALRDPGQAVRHDLQVRSTAYLNNLIVAIEDVYAAPCVVRAGERFPGLDILKVRAQEILIMRSEGAYARRARAFDAVSS